MERSSMRVQDIRSDGYSSQRRFMLARTLCVVLMIFALVVYVASLPVYYARLQTVCVNAVCIPGQLTLERVHAFEHLGISLHLYAASLVVFNVLAALVWILVGVAIFWRKSGDWMALLVALTLIIVGSAVPPDESDNAWKWPTLCVDFLAVVLLFLVFCLFPNGKFVPGWMRWFPVVYLVLNVLDFFPNIPVQTGSGLMPLYFVLLFACIGFLGVTQIYRYRRVSNFIERQQMKWVVFSCSTVILGVFLLWLFTLIFPSLDQITSLYDLFFNPVTNLLILFIPLSLGFAIMRYRLWDIDILINRTLVYGGLTGTLLVVYFISVIGLQALVHLLTGQVGESQFVVVISTLVIAALFQPLRKRIQALIDRRFYRRKYDAARSLAAFSASLRHEVDLNTLTEELVAVVQETMQPAHISLWLYNSTSSKAHKTRRLTTMELQPAEQWEKWQREENG